MKRILVLAICAIVSISTLGQVRIMESTPVKAKEEAEIAQYDSLSNFQLMYHGEHYDYCHLKGQTIVYCGMPYPGYPKRPFKIGDTFYIKDIIDSDLSVFGTAVLQNTKTKATFKEEFSTIENKRWAVNGLMVKLQRLCVGKEFIYKGDYDSKSVYGLISAKDHTPLSGIPYRSIWKCIDIQVKPRHADDGLLMDDRCPVVLIMESTQFGKAYCYYEYDGGPYGNHAVFTQDALFETQEDFTKRMVEKYGEDKGLQIANTPITDAIYVGMTQQMCLDALGKPLSRRKIPSEDYQTRTRFVYPFADVIFSSSRHIVEIKFK